MARLIQKVVGYLWRQEEGRRLFLAACARDEAGKQKFAAAVWIEWEHRVDALDYWPLFPGIVEIEGKRYCKIDDRFRVYCPGREFDVPPDEELLACGHSLPVRTGRLQGGGHGVYFTRRRRCAICLLQA